MSNLQTARQAEIEGRIAQLELEITAAYSAITESLSNGGIESFKFDSNEASQWAKYHNPKGLLRAQEILWQTIDYWSRKLNCTSNIYVALRRKQAYLYGVFS